MEKKRKRIVIGILVFLFIGSLAAMWQATKINLPESERCDGGARAADVAAFCTGSDRG